FLKEVEHITFSADYAREKGQKVLYVTERAVFSLEKTGLVLIEIAPGINLEKEIFSVMDFVPEISKNLKTMDSRIFEEVPMGIKDTK
ncbi:MAG TPA: hypothetical protein PLL89_04655, partial [bacterium]|nr:hypothetical protein [bacterium]